MALHEANQARSSHYPQWHCGPKLHLLATNDILHLLGKHSTTWPQRAHHHLSGQRSVVLPRYRLVPCKQLSRLRNNQRRVHIWSNPNQYSCAHTRYLSSPAAATLHGKTQGFVLRLPPQNRTHVTFMQPFQCDLQPHLQETHRTTHTGTTIVAKHIEGTKRPQPQPPHTRGTFHRRLQPLYTEKHKVSCSGFLPKT